MKEEREDVTKELKFLEDIENRELVRLNRASKKIYAELRRMSSQKISNPVLRSLLKIVDSWLRFRVKKLKRNIIEVIRKKNKIHYALKKFKKGKNEPAKKILEERRAEILAIQSAFKNRFFARL